MRGTAFAVDRQTALTAWHCIVDPQEPSRPLDSVELTFLDGQTTRGLLRQGDPIEDWAILQLEPWLAGELQPIPLRRDVEPWEECRCLGFPVSAAFKEELGFLPVLATVTGEVTRDEARRISVRSIETGMKLDVQGLSGGPLIPRSGREEAVGIMSRRLLDARTREHVGGVLFACPSHLVADKPLLSRPVFDLRVPDSVDDEALVSSAKAGDLRAATALGRTLRDSDDGEDAAAWLREAALAGSASAAYELGLAIDPDGAAVKTDPSRAQEALVWFRRAALAGDLYGAATMGVRLRQHAEHRKRPELKDASMPWLEDAAERGDPMAAHTLALNYEDRHRELQVRADLELAEAWHRFAAEQGDRRAAVFLGRLLKDDGRPGEAIVWLERSLPDEWATSMLEELGADPD
jgi:Trypsin-like peptidase domain